MAEVLDDVAEAVKDDIVDHDFGLEFDSEVSYGDFTKELTKLAGKLFVDVFPFRAPVIGLADRGDLDYEIVNDILVRKKFIAPDLRPDGTVDRVEIKKLLKLVQDIEELFTPSQESDQSGRLASYPDAAWKETEKKMDYSRKHLWTFNQFTGWIRVTHSLARAPG